MDDHATHRSGARFKAGLPAVVRFDGAEHECVARDLSRSGMLLVGAFPWPADQDLEVTVTSAAGDLSFTSRGRLAHVMEDLEAGETKLGLVFEGALDEASAEVLEALVARVVEGTAPAPLERLTEESSPEDVRRELEAMPLPHRIALAQRAITPRERAIIRQDPSPQVLEGLARNPHLNSPEVMTLIRMPTLLPTTIDVLANDPRWRGNEELQVMLATHPRVTLHTAERIVRAMTPSMLRRVIRRPGLHPVLRDRILATTTQRQLKSW